MRFALRFLGVSALAFTAIAPGVAPAAPGGGAVAQKLPCVVSAPGFPDAPGTAQVVVTPKGKEHIVCHAQLPAGTAGPAKPVRIDAGPCTIQISPAGAIIGVCQP